MASGSDDKGRNVRPAVDIEEADLARFFFRRDPRAFPMQSPLDHTLFRVAPPAMGGVERTGDIDVLQWYRFAPENAVAIECKRVKYSQATFDGVLPNKVRALRKGARQATRLLEMGFHNTWLVVFAVVDGRGRSGFNFAFRGWTEEMRGTLEREFDRLALPANTGLLLIELTQPIEKDLFEAASVVRHVIRKPTAVKQPNELTKWVESLNDVAARASGLGLAGPSTGRAGSSVG